MESQPLTPSPEQTHPGTPDEKKMLEELSAKEYEWGFVTDVEADTVPPGLNEDVIRYISAMKNEPA